MCDHVVEDKCSIQWGGKGDSEVYGNNNCGAVLGAGIPPQQAVLSSWTLSDIGD
jgi:hypothetical protein